MYIHADQPSLTPHKFFEKIFTLEEEMIFKWGLKDVSLKQSLPTLCRITAQFGDGEPDAVVQNKEEAVQSQANTQQQQIVKERQRAEQKLQRRMEKMKLQKTEMQNAQTGEEQQKSGINTQGKFVVTIYIYTGLVRAAYTPQ